MDVRQPQDPDEQPDLGTTPGQGAMGFSALSLVAGGSGGPGSSDGIGEAARFYHPNRLAADGLGNLYVADTQNNTIRKVVVATGEVTTLAGTAGQKGSVDGTGPAARFSSPNGVAADGVGNVYVADTSNRTVRKVVVAKGEVTTLAGTAGTSGSTNGIGPAARFQSVYDVASDRAGNLYVVDFRAIRKVVAATGEVMDFAGVPGQGGSTDGIGTAARFDYPQAAAADGGGNLYIADTFNDLIRKIVVATGEVTTLAGGVGQAGNVDGTGPAARFNWPHGVTADGAGNVYVADTLNDTIRKIVVTTRAVSTLAGTRDLAGSTDGIGSAARFNDPREVVVDRAGNAYIADSSNHTIRKLVVATGEVSTLAGTGGMRGNADGTGAAARFYDPYGVALDDAGNLFIADRSNHTIRKLVLSTRAVTTLAGTAGSSGSSNGTGPEARMNVPSGLAADGAGNLYIADSGNCTVRKVVVAPPTWRHCLPANCSSWMETPCSLFTSRHRVDRDIQHQHGDVLAWSLLAHLLQRDRPHLLPAAVRPVAPTSSTAPACRPGG